MNKKLKRRLTILLAIFLGIVTGLAGAAVMNYFYTRKMKRMGLCPCCGQEMENVGC